MRHRVSTEIAALPDSDTTYYVHQVREATADRHVMVSTLDRIPDCSNSEDSPDIAP